MKLTVGIKALNEEANIARCLESALAALVSFEGQVILADSGSTDGTIAIAGGYPVRVVQLARREDACCGAGAQLAFQEAEGDYFYLLDGDMAMDPEILRHGVAYLEAHPDVAGVGGHVIEQQLDSPEFQVRADKARTGERMVDHLECGGLYRMKALHETGYLADRNLHSFEEFDLGARLLARGWKLARIDRPGVYHYGHQTGGYRLLWRRVTSGYAGGVGEILRGAVGQPHLGGVVKRLWALHVAAAVVVWWLALIACLALRQFALFGALLVLPPMLLALRRRSLPLGLYSFATCNVMGIGLVTGFFRKRVPATDPLAARDVAHAR